MLPHPHQLPLVRTYDYVWLCLTLHDLWKMYDYMWFCMIMYVRCCMILYDVVWLILHDCVIMYVYDCLCMIWYDFDCVWLIPFCSSCMLLYAVANSGHFKALRCNWATFHKAIDADQGNSQRLNTYPRGSFCDRYKAAPRTPLGKTRAVRWLRMAARHF